MNWNSSRNKPFWGFQYFVCIVTHFSCNIVTHGTFDINYAFILFSSKISLFLKLIVRFTDTLFVFFESKMPRNKAKHEEKFNFAILLNSIKEVVILLFFSKITIIIFEQNYQLLAELLASDEWL